MTSEKTEIVKEGGIASCIIILFSILQKTKIKLWYRSVYIDNNLPMHSHNFMEIVYINKGEGIHYLNDGEYFVRAGDMILLDFKSVHTFRPKTSDFEWINVLFKPEFITDRLVNEMSEHNMIKLSFFLRPDRE